MSENGNEAFRFLKLVGQLSRAAVPAIDFIHLYIAQQEAVNRILDSIRTIATDSYLDRYRLHEQADGDYRKTGFGAEAYRDGTGSRAARPSIGRDYRSGRVDPPRWRAMGAPHSRPHNCFLINGGRGSGKTTVLNHLAGRIDQQKFTLDDVVERSGSGLTDGALMRMRTFGVSQQRTALLLRVALPNNLEAHESPMEAIFAAVQDRLLLELDRVHDAAEYGRDVNETLKEFLEQVLVGWTFSRREGVQALAQDALDFNDYAKNRATFNLYAHMRIDSWLGFVDRLLDTLGFELLVLIFDDMDLQPEAGQRVVEDIRQYMVHPRTVTIVAADLDRLVDGMVREALTANPKLPGTLIQLDDEEQIRSDGWRGEQLSSFFLDCRQTVLAKIDKVFPPGLRSDLDVNDRDQLDSLLNVSFTKLCVDHFFAHRNPPEGNQNDGAKLVWDEGLAWWFLNAPHSALVTDTIRGYVQFLNGLFHDVLSKRGSNVALPSVDHKPILDVLLAYHKAWPIHQLRANSRDLFEAALQSKTQWHWDNSKKTGAQTLAFIEHLIDFWLDVKIAVNHLDCRKVPALQLWLPLEIESPLEKIGRNLLPTPDLGINGYFRDGVLPRSCLYVYQLRYLDMLADSIRGDLGDSKIVMLSGKLDNDRAEFEIDTTVVREAVDISKLGATQIAHKLRPRLEAEGEGASPSRALLALHIALFRLLHPEEGVVLLDQLRNRFSDPWISLSWKDVEQVFPNGEFVLFNHYLDDWGYLKADESERNFFRSVWILAVHLGVLGTDYWEVKVHEVIRHLGFGFSDDESGRLARLAQYTDELIRKRSHRTGILLAWSLTPVAEPLLRLGCDRRGDLEPAESWKKVQGALEFALTNLDALLITPAGGETAGAQGGQSRREAADGGGRAGAESAEPAAGPIPKSAPERYLKAHQHREWHFPDFTPDQLAMVRADIQKTIDVIREGLPRLETMSPKQPLSANGQSFVDTLSKLTRMSPQSVEVIYARLNRS